MSGLRGSGGDGGGGLGRKVSYERVGKGVVGRGRRRRTAEDGAGRLVGGRYVKLVETCMSFNGSGGGTTNVKEVICFG